MRSSACSGFRRPLAGAACAALAVIGVASRSPAVMERTQDDLTVEVWKNDPNSSVIANIGLRTSAAHPLPGTRIISDSYKSYLSLVLDDVSEIRVTATGIPLAPVTVYGKPQIPISVATWNGANAPSVDGFRVTFADPTNPYALGQETFLEHATVPSTRLRHTVEVTNQSATVPMRFGLRIMWDLEIGTEEAPSLRAIAPSGTFSSLLFGPLPPAFRRLEISDLAAIPLSVFVTVQGEGARIPSPAPDMIRLANLDDAFQNPWDFADSAPTGNTALVMYYGYTAPIVLAPNSQMTFTHYLGLSLPSIAPFPVLKKSSEPSGPVAAGERVAYRVSWSNAGVGTTTALTITDTLPAGTAYSPPPAAVVVQADDLGTPAVTSSYATGWAGPWIAGEPASGTAGPLLLRWTVDRVAPARSGSVVFNAAVSAALAAGSVVRNGASATSFAQDSPAGPAAVASAVTNPRVSLAKQGPGSTAAVLPFDFTITVDNPGAVDVYRLAVVDTLAAELSFVSAGGSPVVSGKTVYWFLDELKAGASTTLSLRVSGVDAVSPYTVANSAGVTFWSRTVGGYSPPSLDAATTVTLTPPQPAVDLILSFPAQAPFGEPVTFAVTVANSGNGTAYGVVLVETLPAPLVFLGASVAPLTASPVLTWNAGDIAPGASFTVVITVRGPPATQPYVTSHPIEATYWTRTYPGSAAPAARPPGGPTAVTFVFVQKVRVYPNPFDRTAAYPPGAGRLKFSGLPDGATVRIFTLSGAEVTSSTDGGREWLGSPPPHRQEWTGHNRDGSVVAPGIYHFVVESADGSPVAGGRGRFSVIR